jgi:hypothetical protein
MKIQFVNDEGKVIEIVPDMRIVLCEPEYKNQNARYTVALIAPDGSLLATAEYFRHTREREMYPVDLGLIYKAFEHLAEGILVLAGFGWRSDYWNWRKAVEERLEVRILHGYMVLE